MRMTRLIGLAGIVALVSASAAPAPAKAQARVLGDVNAQGSLTSLAAAVSASASGVACVSLSECMAVVSVVPAHADQPVLAGELWDGKTWTPQPISLPAGVTNGQARGVSCVASGTSPQGCMAVVSFANGDPARPVLAGELWNGEQWAPRPIPLPAGATRGQVPAVACGSITQCMAVVSFARGDPSSPVLAGELWDGTAWVPELLPRPFSGTSERVSGVSCVPLMDCMVVVSFVPGTPGKPVLVGELWNGKAWTVHPIPLPPGATHGMARGVSCESIAVCMAVVSYVLRDPAKAILAGELWNGETWTPQPMPLPLTATRGQVTAISCVPLAGCVAVGSYTDGGTGSPVLLAELWQGKAWTIEPMASDIT